MKKIVTTIVLAFLISNGCNWPSAATENPSPQAIEMSTPEAWASKPKREWPQLVLTNDAKFNGHSDLNGASSFLLRTENGAVFAATARHLIGDAGGVEPEIPVNELNEKIKTWKMYPRTLPDDFVNVTSVGAKGLDNAYLDWLVLRIEPKEKLPSLPLKLRKERARIGETLFLVGCPYSERNCKQNVYECKVTNRDADYFRYDVSPPVNIRGFSGAPIVDSSGHLVGVMAGWFDPKMSGDDFLEGGGHDIAPIAHLIGQ